MIVTNNLVLVCFSGITVAPSSSTVFITLNTHTQSSVPQSSPLYDVILRTVTHPSSANHVPSTCILLAHPSSFSSPGRKKHQHVVNVTCVVVRPGPLFCSALSSSSLQSRLFPFGLLALVQLPPAPSICGNLLRTIQCSFPVCRILPVALSICLLRTLAPIPARRRDQITSPHSSLPRVFSLALFLLSTAPPPLSSSVFPSSLFLFVLCTLLFYPPHSLTTGCALPWICSLLFQCLRARRCH